VGADGRRRDAHDVAEPGHSERVLALGGTLHGDGDAPREPEGPGGAESAPGDLRLTTVVSTTLALLGFAANSILCRLALRDGAIDAATFSTIRLVSGALMLLVLARGAQGSWTSAGLLALYAVPFSFAYNDLSAGTGALILFGSVQVTMLTVALGRGERPRVRQWIGLAAAVGGLVYFVVPGLTAPPPGAAALMALAGIAWGFYSWRGRGASNPLAHTAGNFVRSIPFVVAVSLVSLPGAHAATRGVLLSIASGAVTSGLGYVAWYAALRGLTGTQAAVVQLSVPLIAAAGGVLLLAEAISARLVVATIVVLGGVALATLHAGIGRQATRTRT
jgi:drug/metabolite transporter (DMT)-like permease